MSLSAGRRTVFISQEPHRHRQQRGRSNSWLSRAKGGEAAGGATPTFTRATTCPPHSCSLLSAPCDRSSSRRRQRPCASPSCCPRCRRRKPWRCCRPHRRRLRPPALVILKAAQNVVFPESRFVLLQPSLLVGSLCVARGSRQNTAGFVFPACRRSRRRAIAQRAIQDGAA